MKRFYFFTILLISNAVTLTAQNLVKDINSTPGAVFNTNANIQNMTSAGNKTYFTANDASSGDEPWVTDGTEAGTHILRDINPGKSGSTADYFTYSNGYVYFQADDGAHGRELWKTDGTAVGTVMVKDINSTYTSSGVPNSSGANNLCDVNGTLYFTVSAGSTLDYTLWKTDGTEAGTVQVNNLNTVGQGPANLINFNGGLYFTEIVTASNYNIYRVLSNGSTELVMPNIGAYKLIVIGSTLYFTGLTNANGVELWKTDGTTTEMIKDINPGIAYSSPDWLTNVNGILFFTADDGVNGAELWKSDGSAAGTVMVKDITIADNTSANKPTALCNVNGTLFFNGYTTAAYKELWKSDGTEAGTLLVKDIIPGPSFPGGNPTELINNNGILLFKAGSATNEFWKSDGTEAGTVQVKVFNGFENLTLVDALPGNIVFSAAVGTGNYKVWKSDGTTAGTMLLKTIATDNPPSLVSGTRVGARFAYSNGQLFFGTKNGVTSTGPYSLYKTYGTDPATFKLNEAVGGFVKDAVNAGGNIYFSVTTSEQELWKSDGTAAGTALLKDINPGPIGSVPTEMYNMNGIVYFTARSGSNGAELWKTDGTAAGTVMVKDINPGSGSSSPSQFIQFNGEVYFAATNGTNGIELWKTDGTTAGTVMVKDINTGNGNSLIATGGLTPGNYFTIAGNQLFFSAFGSTSEGRELWKTDGTSAGTVLVKDIAVNSSSSPIFIIAVGNKVFFAADDSNFEENYELWQSDGTTSGTIKVKEINPGNAPSWPCNIINLNGVVYFSAFEPGTGYELWKSDGTAAGTVLVKDIEPGKFSGMSSGYLCNTGGGSVGVEFRNITESNGTLYFTATTAENGRELWQSDGTAAGTTMVGDLFPGPQSSDPEQIRSAGGDIYFVADNGVSGKELYVYKPIADYILPMDNAVDSININWENNSLVYGTNQIITTIKQTGNSPLNGIVKTKFTVDAAATVYNNRTLAKKHVDIEPVANPTTSTATVTLYFSQADFNEYNVADILNGDLPTASGDVLGKANLRIIQYHGVGTEPVNYPGAEEIIDPADDSIVWNTAGNYWEVSFTVTGFSGFYLSSATSGPLPVRLISFNGKLNAQQQVDLEWKVAEQQGIIRYEIERSTAGNNFSNVGNVNANNQTSFTYRFTDVQPFTGTALYRIKIIDQDGRITYSKIISVQVAVTNAVHLFPVPAGKNISIQLIDVKYLNTDGVIMDNTGRTVMRFKISSVLHTADVSRLATGLYYVRLMDGNVLKFQKL